MEPTATTVATDEPDIEANSAQAITPASPIPPYQWPTIAVAKSIIRLATPPRVRKFPARMKNGIDIISNFSMPVNSLSATACGSTSVNVKRKVRTVRPRAIEIGIPVAIIAIRIAKINKARAVQLKMDDAVFRKKADGDKRERQGDEKKRKQPSRVMDAARRILLRLSSCDPFRHNC